MNCSFPSNIIFYSGEEDGTVPCIGTLKHIKKLAKNMSLNLTKDEAWTHENKVIDFYPLIFYYFLFS